MSDVSVKCVFCGKETSAKIKNFTPETLKKCMTILEYRKMKPIIRKSRKPYAAVEISNETSLDNGYHVKCYKLFTAIKIPADFQRPVEIKQESAQEYDDAPEIAEESDELLISSISTTQTAGKIVDKAGPSSNPEPSLEDYNDEQVVKEDSLFRECFICKKSRKRRNGGEMPLAINKLQTIKSLYSAATKHNDIEMMEKINSYTDSSSIPYHKCCKDLYLREIGKKEGNNSIKKQKALSTAYDSLCEYLEKYIVQRNECLFFDHVKKEYHRLLIKEYNLLSEPLNSTLFSDIHLESKIIGTFAKKIKIICVERKKFLAPISANIVDYNNLFKTMAIKEKIRSVAAQLRHEIINSTMPLPEHCTAEELNKGECNYVPELLTCFLETLVSGDDSHLSRKKRKIRENKNNFTIYSIGQDLMYAASNHKIKTSKHITLGLATKNLCNSKKIIDMLSKYGHCCSYTALEPFLLTETQDEEIDPLSPINFEDESSEDEY